MKPTLTSHEQAGIRLIRRNSAALLPLVIVLFFFALGSSKAHATCGDYLSHHHSVDLRAAGNPAEQDSTTPRIPLRLPCRGPSCHGGPVQVPLSTPIVSVDFQDHWVWFASLSINAPEQASYRVHSAEAIVLPEVPFRLERPPKA